MITLTPAGNGLSPSLPQDRGKNQKRHHINCYCDQNQDDQRDPGEYRDTPKPACVASFRRVSFVHRWSHTRRWA